ncbi:MAG: MMPL family transporter [Planctomycetes bacterium]|nr:MMPL family transporter [Planctomycetota bacterium]
MDQPDLQHESLTTDAKSPLALGVVRYRRPWTVLVFVLFGISTWPIAHYLALLRTDNSIESWLGDSDPAVKAYQQFSKEFNANELLIVAFDHCTYDDPRLELLANRLEQHDAILRCLTAHRLAEMMEIWGIENTSPPLLGKKPDFSGLFAEVQTDPTTDRKALLRYVRRASESVGFDTAETHLGGPTSVNVALDEAAEASMRQLMPIVIGVSLFFLGWSLRDWRLVLMLIFCSGMTVLLTLAMMSAYGAKLNLIGIAIPPMLLVLSLSFGLHLIHHWRLAPNAEFAASYAVSKTFRPTLLAASTTAIGCASLVTSQFAPVRAFGVWAAVGTLVAVAVTYLFAPVYLSSDRRHSNQIQHATWAGLMVQQLPARSVFAVWCLLTIVACVGLQRLTCESDALKFLPQSAKLTQDYELIERRLTGLLNIEAIVEFSSEVPLADRIRHFRDYAAALRKHSDVEDVFDFLTFFPQSDEETADILRELKSQRRLAPMLRTRLNKNQTRWRLTANVASTAGQRLGAIVNELPQAIESKMKVTYTGVVPLILAAQHEIFAGLGRSLLAASAVLWVLLTLAFRSPRTAFLLLLLNISPVLIVFGLLGWLGHPVNIATLTTATVALGVALDDTLHFVAHFQSETSRQPSRCRRDIAALTAEKCFRPMMQTTLVASLGLGTLAFSSFVPIAEFGVLLSALLIVALLGDLILLPALLSTAWVDP